MPKSVLLIGHCGPDSSYLRIAVRAAAPGATITMANDQAELDLSGIDLALVNRLLDGDFPDMDGVDLIQRLRQTNPGVKFILVSNFASAQTAARAAGAAEGFGKRDIGSPLATHSIRKALEQP